MCMLIPGSFVFMQYHILSSQFPFCKPFGKQLHASSEGAREGIVDDTRSLKEWRMSLVGGRGVA